MFMLSTSYLNGGSYWLKWVWPLPMSIIIAYPQHKQLSYLLKLRPEKKIRYSLSFTSLISPGNMTNIRLVFLSTTSWKNKKLLLKQSYLLLTWAYYLTRSNSKLFKRPSISIRPTKQSKFTSLKAPMAHKTFSQEQFWIRFYRLKINFTVYKTGTSILNSLNKSFYTILLLRTSLPLTETNLMLLKSFAFEIPSSDSSFFTLRNLS